MTSIYDIRYEDIEKFLLANNEDPLDQKDAYDKTLILLKNKKSVEHTTSIIEWMIAHNLLMSKINVPNYAIYEIDNMSQNEVDELAKLLTMKGNNRENIKNILRFLNKLNDIIPSPNEQTISLSKKQLLPSLNKKFIDPDISISETQERDKEIILNKLDKLTSESLLLDVTNYDYYFDENNVDIWAGGQTNRSRTARRKPTTGRTAKSTGVTFPKFTRGIREKTIYDDDLNEYDTIPGNPLLIVRKDNPEIYHNINIIMNDNQ